jgi:hypothetical protein
VLGDLCKRRGGEIAGAERDDPLAVEAGLHVFLAGPEPERPPYTVARVDA